MADSEYGVERHGGDEPAVCVGQWCCGCDEHPIGKPWGWNYEAWERHYAVCPREKGGSLVAVLERKECTRCGRDWNLPPNSGGCACEFLLPHEATVVRYVPEAEVERLRHLIYDAHKWLPHAPETAAAVLKRTADDYANGGS